MRKKTQIEAMEEKEMKSKDIGKIQLIIAVIEAIYIVMPDLFIGPIDDTALAAIAGIAEAVLSIMRAISPPSNPRQENVSKEYYSDDYSEDNY